MKIACVYYFNCMLHILLKKEVYFILNTFENKNKSIIINTLQTVYILSVVYQTLKKVYCTNPTLHYMFLTVK